MEVCLFVLGKRPSKEETFNRNIYPVLGCTVQQSAWVTFPLIVNFCANPARVQEAHNKLSPFVSTFHWWAASRYLNPFKNEEITIIVLMLLLQAITTTTSRHFGFLTSTQQPTSEVKAWIQSRVNPLILLRKGFLVVQWKPPPHVLLTQNKCLWKKGFKIWIVTAHTKPQSITAKGKENNQDKHIQLFQAAHYFL